MTNRKSGGFQVSSRLNKYMGKCKVFANTIFSKSFQKTAEMLSVPEPTGGDATAKLFTALRV